MKLIILLTILVLSFACGIKSVADERTSAKVNTSNSSRSTENSAEFNANSYVPPPSERNNVDQAKRKEIEEQNKKFRDVPDAFKSVDFKNFSYPTKSMKGVIKLKNGEFEYEDRKVCDNHFGGLRDVFYVNSKNDYSKQALVFLTDVACGCGSCDGGSILIYLYDIRNNKPVLFWRYATGSYAYGGGLKSFQLKDKKITVEEFAKCSDEDAKINGECNSKFSTKNVIRTNLVFNGKTFITKSEETIETPVTNVMNYQTEISIDN